MTQFQKQVLNLKHIKNKNFEYTLFSAAEQENLKDQSVVTESEAQIKLTDNEKQNSDSSLSVKNILTEESLISSEKENVNKNIVWFSKSVSDNDSFAVKMQDKSAVIDMQTKNAAVKTEDKSAVIEMQTESAAVKIKDESAVIEMQTKSAAVKMKAESAAVEMQAETEIETEIKKNKKKIVVFEFNLNMNINETDITAVTDENKDLNNNIILL
ncbi:MAG: hypothetical protein M1830_005587 [Pleopsidium flavum]|nr:MAG: hypothetical protein M1830_005587 [Pleopsidium flavum]